MLDLLVFRLYAAVLRLVIQTLHEDSLGVSDLLLFRLVLCRSCLLHGMAEFSAVDPVSGAVFCRQCDDMIFSDHFERLRNLALARVEEAHDISREISVIGKGRERGAFKPWAASPEGLAVDTVKNPCRGGLIKESGDNVRSSRQVFVLCSTCLRRASFRPSSKP